MAAWLDNVKFNPTAGSTTDWTFSTAVSGYQSPSAGGVVNGRLYKYFAVSADLSQWEIGEGAYNTGTGVLARTTVLYNSSATGTATGQSGAGTKINFSTAPIVAVVGLKEDLISIEEANAFSTAQKAQARTNIGAGPETTPITNSLGADVALNNTANYFDGPSVAQGTSGTWFVSGTVTLIDTTGVCNYFCKLWDGTTVIASVAQRGTGLSNYAVVSLSGFITSPAGNLRISCRDTTNTTGSILFNATGNSKDSTITAIRIQ